MTLTTRSDKESQRWLAIAQTAPDPKVLQRAPALLWLRAGEDATEVAQRLFGTPRTVYRWLNRLQQQPHLALSARLDDSPRSGCPRLAGGVIDPLLAQLLEEDPRQRGSRSTVWTAALLRHALRASHRIEVAQRSVRRALAR